MLSQKFNINLQEDNFLQNKMWNNFTACKLKINFSSIAALINPYEYK